MSIRATPWEQASLPVLDEAACVAWRLARGQSVVEHRGRYWWQSRPGFFQPVHHMARFRLAEATRPRPWCLGFRAMLAEEEGRANGALAIHRLSEPRSYDIGRLSPPRRQQIRRALRDFDVVALDAPDILLDQGYALGQEARARNAEIHLPEPAAFRREVETYLDPPRGLILAAVRGDRLLGFTLTFAVGRTAYNDSVYVGEEGLAKKVPVCLFHAFASLVARAPGVDELMHGFHIRENGGLNEFKRRVGLEIVRLPARVWLFPGLDHLLRTYRPDKYYQVTGRGSPEPAGERQAA